MGPGPIAGIVIGVVLVSLVIFLVANHYWKEHVYQKKLALWKEKQLRIKEQSQAQPLMED